MACITYLQANGEARSVEVADGHSIMQGAVTHGIPGILATCGGALACATCHVIVDSEWWDQVGPPSEDESDLLDFAEGREQTSRLSCQIVVAAGLDGISVRIPDTQA